MMLKQLPVLLILWSLAVFADDSDVSGIHFVCFMCIDWMATCEAERHMLLEANKVPKIPASKWSNQWGGNVWSYTASCWSVLKFDNYLYLTKICVHLGTLYINYMFIITGPGKTVTFGLDTKRLVVSWCQRRKCSASRKMNLKLLLIFEFLIILVFVAQNQLKHNVKACFQLKHCRCHWQTLVFATRRRVLHL